MTVGIGLLCSHGKHILLAADMRASYGEISQNDQTGKLFDLPFNFCGAMAGTLSWCSEVSSELYHRMSKMKESEVVVEKVREAIVESYTRIYMLLGDEELRNELKISMNDFHRDRTLAPSICRTARNILKAVEVPVDLIVAGFVGGGPILLTAIGGTTVTIRAEVTPGNAVIGSGSIAALNWLNYRKQSYSCGLAHSLLHLTEAKQFAQVEQTVGPLRQIALLWPGGWKGIEGGQELIQGWWNKYGLPQSVGLEQEQHNQATRDTFGITQ